MPPAVPRVAVAMITWNRKATVLATLARLAALPDRPPVVVVDSGSTDGTPEVVASAFPAVRVIPPGRNAGAAGRTAGVRAIRAPYLLAFCDDDSWWDPGHLSGTANLFDAHPRLALVTARVLVGTCCRRSTTAGKGDASSIA